ncbi:hypothetical protein CBM2634_A200098 [Cupriavidus taiwanensis]|uniref:Uncharacterized protein n=1 Tax=Cupriavidus taiwanensis TaxID=164546 RepID=A0A375J2G3_9BURK|nr:hypothetical protein CBM2634_A200098 [Cupriavidus taiwanensis]
MRGHARAGRRHGAVRHLARLRQGRWPVAARVHRRAHRAAGCRQDHGADGGRAGAHHGRPRCRRAGRGLRHRGDGGGAGAHLPRRAGCAGALQPARRAAPHRGAGAGAGRPARHQRRARGDAAHGATHCRRRVPLPARRGSPGLHGAPPAVQRRGAGLPAAALSLALKRATFRQRPYKNRRRAAPFSITRREQAKQETRHAIRPARLHSRRRYGGLLCGTGAMADAGQPPGSRALCAARRYLGPRGQLSLRQL